MNSLFITGGFCQIVTKIGVILRGIKNILSRNAEVGSTGDYGYVMLKGTGSRIRLEKGPGTHVKPGEKRV
jgi:hypothetical protein